MKVSFRARLTQALIILVLPLTYNACGGFKALDRADVLSQGSLTNSEGKTLFAQNCSSCHQMSDKTGRTAQQISNAIATQPLMNHLSTLSSADIQKIADALSPAPVGGIQQKYTCTNPLTRGMSDDGMRRLTYEEYKNTITDFFGADVVAATTALSGFPIDTLKESVGEFNPYYQRNHVDAVLNVSLQIAGKVVANPTYLSRIAPACIGQGLSAGSISDSCLTGFIDAFGMKAHRRPLTAAQEQSYLAFYKDAALSTLTPSVKLETLIAKILHAPEMLYMWSYAPQPAAPGYRARVDAYTVASRLSYQLTGSMPDANLMTAAANGDLNDLDKVRLQADRLISTPRGRAKIRSLFSLWLRTYKVPAPTATAAARAGVAGTDSDMQALRTEAVGELLDFAEYVIVDMNGTYSDLLRSDVAFPRSSRLAKILGTSVSTGSPVRSGNGAYGLLMRPALLFSGADRESPIKRGVTLRTRILCDPVPPPPPDADAAASQIGSTFDSTMFTTRDVANKLTGSGTCVTCHSRLNPLGFALGYFGPLGEYRTTDQTYKADGTPQVQLPINTAVSNLDVVTPFDSATGHDDMVTLVSSSMKANACFATYAFRAARLRTETSADDCQLSDAEQLLSSGTSIKEALIKTVTAEDILWRGF